MSAWPIDANTSEVSMEMTYTPKWGFLGKVLDVLMLRMEMRHTFNQVLKGLQHHVETGELIGKGGKPVQRHVQAVSLQGG